MDLGAKKTKKKGKRTREHSLTHLLTLSLMCSIHHYRSNPIPKGGRKKEKKKDVKTRWEQMGGIGTEEEREGRQGWIWMDGELSLDVEYFVFGASTH